MTRMKIFIFFKYKLNKGRNNVNLIKELRGFALIRKRVQVIIAYTK